MTVKELNAILSNVDNNEREVFMDSYSVSAANGYYYTTRDGKEALILTTLPVQPFKMSET